MQRQSPLALVAAGLATSIVVWTGSDQAVEASGGATTAAEIDLDGDFLPDIVEWVTLTSRTNPDTDGDANSDFVEVISGSDPRTEGPALPADQQMRVFVTGSQPGSTDPRAWMHVFYRVMPTGGAAAGVNSVQAFDAWIENPSLPGLQISLNALFASPEVVYAERVTAEQGTWMQLSAPMVAEPILQAVSPCTVWVESTVMGQQLQSGVQLLPVPAGMATMIPIEEGRFVLQTTSPIPSTSTSLTIESNKVCVLTLEEDTSGPAGTTYIVTDADCDDANDLECDSTCSQSVGWTVTIPGGTELLSGS